MEGLLDQSFVLGLAALRSVSRVEGVQDRPRPARVGRFGALRRSRFTRLQCRAQSFDCDGLSNRASIPRQIEKGLGIESISAIALRIRCISMPWLMSVLTSTPIDCLAGRVRISRSEGSGSPHRGQSQGANLGLKCYVITYSISRRPDPTPAYPFPAQDHR